MAKRNQHEINREDAYLKQLQHNNPKSTNLVEAALWVINRDVKLGDLELRFVNSDRQLKAATYAYRWKEGQEKRSLSQLISDVLKQDT